MTALTVFTPTYDRASTLPRLFESLERQTSRDFLWFVVDDGSSDNTRELIQKWQASAEFEIEYLYQENRGKHNAHNAAVAKADTDLFLIIDSDDELLPHAVETIVSAWSGMSPDEKRRIAGIWTLCRYADGEIIGGSLGREVLDSTLQELRYKHRDYREMTPCFTTAVLREYPFPETPPGMCPFIPEDYVWTRITRTHPIRILNTACRIYHQGDGLSVIGRDEYRLSRCIVYGYFGHVVNDLEWFWYEPMAFLLSAVQLARYGIFSGGFGKLAKALPWKAKLLVFGAVPIAALLLLRDRLSGRIAKQLGAAK